MSPKKPYQKRLPGVLPPAPRRAPAQESLPAPDADQGRGPAPGPEPVRPSDREPAPHADAASDAASDAAPGPAPAVPPRAVPPRAAAPAAPTTPVRPPAPTAVRAPEPRPRGLLLAVAGGVALLVVAGVVAAVTLEPRDPPPEDGSVSIDTLGAPRVLLPDESYVESRVLTDGDVVVRQWIRSEQPLQELRLTLPEVEGAEGLQAERIVVEARGVRAVGPTVLTSGGATYTFTDTTELRIRYRLTGATELSDSAEGRALARATSLEVGYTPGIARDTRVVRAAEVLALACEAPSEAPLPCGGADGTESWQVDLEGPRVADRVLAQLDLG